MKKNEQNKYNAVWLSHSSVSDFLKCPRLYYLKNIWKNSNGNKVNIVSPHMSLGSAVHQVIEPLANLKVEQRRVILGLTTSYSPTERETEPANLLDLYEEIWKKYSGKMGGFLDIETEKQFKERGLKMIENVIRNPGPLLNKTVKFYTGDFIPNIYLSENDNIILCGLVDWVEYNEKDDSLKVIDFKTGKNEEKEESFQLPIYKILVESLQKRKVNCGAYWYLDKDKFPTTKELLDEDITEVKKKLLEIGLEIKKLKSDSKNIEKNFVCKYALNESKCYGCSEVELIKVFDAKNSSDRKLMEDRIEYLGQGEYKQDLYIIKKEN